MAEYVLDPTEEQDSIAAYLRTEFPFVPVIEDGLMDDQIYTNLDGSEIAIPTFPDGTVKPFIILWFSNAKRSARGRSIADYKLDAHFATVDVVVVARNGTDARKLLNKIGNRMVGFRTSGGGRLYKSASLWGDSRQVIDDDNRPTRWARTDRFDFGIQARKI